MVDIDISSVRRVAAFSNEMQGGNPAGVLICETLPADEEMQLIAKTIAYSETAFLQSDGDAWRIRYFAPDMEVPFCGHATIASGAILGEQFGEGVYQLALNDGLISVKVWKNEFGTFTAQLVSPNTWSEPAKQTYVDSILDSFGYSFADLNDSFPVSIAFAGAKHLIVVLNDRKQLSQMRYVQEKLSALMQEESLITINLLWQESEKRFHSRNPCPSVGVYEDPATGAAAAALAGYLRDIDWQGSQQFEIIQGEDMGFPSRIMVDYDKQQGSGVRISGETYNIEQG